MVELYQHNEGFIHFEASYSERKVVFSVLRYEHPDKEYSPAYRDNKWDGIVRFYDKTKQNFPSGFKSIVIEALDSKKIAYESYRENEFVTKLEFSKEILSRKYQHKAIKQFFREKHGIIKVPTRGGKTFIAAEIIRHIKHDNTRNTLFIVDTLDLLLQAKKDIASHIEGMTIDDIGEIRGDAFNIQQITIATIQTLQSITSGAKRGNKAMTKESIKAKNLRKKTLLNYIKTIHLLIVDECHEYSSKSRLSFISRFLKIAEFKLFISATPFKSENELDNLNLRTVCGDIIYEIKESDLKKQGYLSEDIVLLINIDHEDNKNISLEEGDDDYNEYLKQIITHNFYRNTIIINFAEILRKYVLKTLILFSRKEHGYYIKSITGDAFVSGDTALDDRTFIRTNFLKKKGGVLLASDVFKKGITLPEVQIMINAGGGLEQSLVIQKKGRVLGVTETKTKALMIDFIDNYRYFSEHSLNRAEVYIDSVGMDKIHVLDSADKEFYPMFRNIIENWFDL